MIRFLLCLTALVGAVSALPYSASVDVVSSATDIKACLSQLNGGDRPLINPQGIQVVADHTRFVWAKPVGEAAQCYAFKTDFAPSGSLKPTYPLAQCGVSASNDEIRNVSPVCRVVASVNTAARNATYTRLNGDAQVSTASTSSFNFPAVSPGLSSSVLDTYFGGVTFEYALRRTVYSAFYNAAENTDGVYGAGAEYINQLSGNDTTANDHNKAMAVIKEDIVLYTLSSDYRTYAGRFLTSSYGKTTVLDQLTTVESALSSRPNITLFERVSNEYSADKISRTFEDMASQDPSKLLFGRDIDTYLFEWTGGETASEHFSLTDVDESNEVQVDDNFETTSSSGSSLQSSILSGNLSSQVFDGKIFDSASDGDYVAARVQSRIHFEYNVVQAPLTNEITTEGYAAASADALAVVSRMYDDRSTILYSPWAVLGYKISDVPDWYYVKDVTQTEQFGDELYYDLATEAAGRAKAVKDVGDDLFVPVTLAEKNSAKQSGSSSSDSDLTGVGVILIAIFFSIAIIVSTVLYVSLAKPEVAPGKSVGAAAGVSAKVPAPPADA